MKNYMVTHTFKSKEMKEKFTETVASMKMEDIVKSMKSDNAACQMTWNTPGDTMEMFCWWKGKDEEAIINQLGQMNDFFTPHKFVECTDQVMDYNAQDIYDRQIWEYFLFNNLLGSLHYCWKLRISLTFRPIRSCVHAVIERRLLP